MTSRPFDQLQLVFGEAPRDGDTIAETTQKDIAAVQNQTTLGGENGVVNGSRTQSGPAISGSAGEGRDLSTATSGGEVQRIEGQQPVERLFGEPGRAGLGADSPGEGSRLQSGPGGGAGRPVLVSRHVGDRADRGSVSGGDLVGRESGEKSFGQEREGSAGGVDLVPQEQAVPQDSAPVL